MSVVNFRVKKLSGERTEMEKKDISTIDVSSNFMILSIKKGKDDRIGEYLLVNFRFNVRYKPDLGKIDLDGFLWYTDPNLKKIVTEKEGKIELKSDAVREISNAILRDSILESVYIARTLGLPIPVNLPKVNVKPKEVRFPKAS